MDIGIAIPCDQLQTRQRTIGHVGLKALACGSTDLSHDAIALGLAVLLLRHRGAGELIIATDVVSRSIELEDIRERVLRTDLDLIARLRIEVSATTATRDQLTILIVEALAIRIERRRLVGDIEATQRRIEGERFRGLIDQTEAVADSAVRTLVILITSDIIIAMLAVLDLKPRGIAIAVVIIADRSHGLELLRELKDIRERKAMYPRVLRRSLRECRLYVPIEAGVVGRILRVGEDFTIAIEGATSTLHVRPLVPCIASTL